MPNPSLVLPPADRRVRFRLLPWRLRRRVKGLNDDLSGLDDVASLIDDPVAVAIAGVLLVAALLVVVAPLLLGLALLPFELAALVLAAVVELLLRALHLRPWTLAVEERLDGRWVPVHRVQVTGLAAARRERDALQGRSG